MKVCFPVEKNDGLESAVYGHFGSAPVFVVYDTQTNGLESIGNQDLGHEHGMCNPLLALNGKSVDAIVVGGIGAGAINKLNAMGIKVYKAGDGTIKSNIALFQGNSLAELTINNACSHHGGCGH
jgi:predicted Fe-Mo cluster-binding NifX family protein